MIKKKIDSTTSTNSWVAQHEEVLPSEVLVYCNHQTAGRGQKGNTWESAPGKNITASLLFHPKDFKARNQFAISEMISLAICEFLDAHGVESEIKWPNDIYVGDKKICGILVENVILGDALARCIAGFGININQKEFVSDAPNPVSLAMLTGKEYTLEEMIENLSVILSKNLVKLNSGEDYHEKFLNKLWRKDGKLHKFMDKKQNQLIDARIEDVSREGELTLVTSEGEPRKYLFKEVEFII